MKMASQRFCLRWNNHQSNLLSVFDQLLHAETFTDVTLAVDGQYLKAHKMVLSACSPYFNALFVNHPEKHPIVILKDVPFSDMKSLLDFMYRGEVSVDQERLTAFLRVAESLRIKGLTEVNDDKPADTTPTPPPAPPQLQRIQPYLIQQQQQHHQPQRNKTQSLLNTNAANNNNNHSNSNNTAQAQAQQQQQQHSLLSSALASMPKRKRGRPRKLSGSSNGTGNEYDEYEREGVMNDLELGEGKMGNENFSGNEDISDDNRAESCDNEQDLNESRDSASQPKKAKQQKKDSRSQQSNDNDNSTSAQLINASPELSQRLFGSSAAALMALQKQKSHQQQTKETAEIGDAATHLPTALGLKMRVNTQLQQKQSSASSSSNSLLKQQLRSGLKDETINSSSNKPNISNNGHSKNGQTGFEEHRNGNSAHEPCSGLQSLANAAERQAAVNAIQPPTASNLHHQFLIHMAANPMLNAGTDYFKQQQQQKEELLTPAAVECILEPLPDNRSEPELTLADEAAGLGYKSPDQTNSTPNKIPSPASVTTDQNPTNKTNTPRPVQRRRIRRKAQSSIDDQAEHLTEMSVRGLDLFRYASITEGVYQCTECAKENVQKTFKNKYSFQRHAFLYHEGKHRKVFPCPVCGKEFSRPDKMKNHMKMTHESFVSKQDLNTYHPLNYLISAAATGDLHSSLFPPSQAQQAENEAALMRDEVASVGGGSDNVGVNLTQRQSGSAALPTPVDALLKLQQELVIKNEFISPSPSPPPTSSLTRTQPSQPHTQRLEEVK